jgi:molybdopterin-biosynthesis enzyme MoeA-like protein
MQAMFETLAPKLAGGPPIVARAVHTQGVPEGKIADGLAAIQARYPALDLGSYPYYRGSGGGVAIVAKGTEPDAAEAAIAEVTLLMRELGGTPVAGEPPVA